MSGTFCSLLKSYMNESGINRAELSRKTGLTAQYVGRVVSGAARPPQRKTCEAIANALGLKSDEAKMLLRTAAEARLNEIDYETVKQIRMETIDEMASTPQRKCPKCGFKY